MLLLLAIILIASIGLIVSVVVLVCTLILVVIVGSSLSSSVWLICWLSWGWGNSLCNRLWILLFRRVISFLSYDENIFITSVVIERSRERINDWLVIIDTYLSVIFSLPMFNDLSRSILLRLLLSDDKSFIFNANLGLRNCGWQFFLSDLRVLFDLRIVIDFSVGVCNLWYMNLLILVFISVLARAFVCLFIRGSLLFPLQSAVIFPALWDRVGLNGA